MHTFIPLTCYQHRMDKLIMYSNHVVIMSQGNLGFKAYTSNSSMDVRSHSKLEGYTDFHSP